MKVMRVALAASILGLIAAAVAACYPPSYPDQIGWMDDKPLAAADRRRIAELIGQGAAGDTGHLSIIRSLQAGTSSEIGRRDFELLRQDRRRAMAAYPNVAERDLLSAGWFQVDLSAKIPTAWNTSGNGEGTQGADGRWYLDGGVLIYYVASGYPDRASSEATEAFFKAKAERIRAAKLARTMIWWTSYGPDTLSAYCGDGTCVVRQAERGAPHGKAYTFPFVAAEWVHDPSTMREIAALPSFAKAVAEDVEVKP